MARTKHLTPSVSSLVDGHRRQPQQRVMSKRCVRKLLKELPVSARRLKEKLPRASWAKPRLPLGVVVFIESLRLLPSKTPSRIHGRTARSSSAASAMNSLVTSWKGFDG